jgi:peptidoglycan/xylan/chitin deacetylase (PgdA/CDA1 family)
MPGPTQQRKFDMRRLRILSTLFVVTALALMAPRLPRLISSTAHAASEPIKHHNHHGVRLAVTVDDLPGGGPEVGELTHPLIVEQIVAVLRAHHVQRPTGFIVGSMLEGHPERQAALDSWVEAGFEVGNHTYSHRTIGDMGLQAYLDDITKNSTVVDALEKRSGQHGRYFRYPYLEEGRTEGERKALMHFLAVEHYTVARVSIDFGDWAWAAPHARCLERNDAQAIELLAQSYLANGSALLAWSVDVAHQVFGRSIPHVLLLHANMATAHNLDALLTAYESTGVRYISLAEALSDPIYTAAYTSSGGNVIGQASREIKRRHSPWIPRPLELLELACH